MRKFLLSIAALLIAGAAYSDGIQAVEVVENSAGAKVLRSQGHSWLWGFGPSVPTTFNSENIPRGAAWFDTDDGIVYVYGASGWTSGAAAGGFATLTGTNAFTGANSFIDGSLTIKGSSDATKTAKFEVDGFNAGAAITFNLPGTVAGTSTLCVAGINCSFSAIQQFGGHAVVPAGFVFGSGTTALLTTVPGFSPYRTEPTPDSGYLYTGTLANSVHLAEVGDLTFDFNNGPAGTGAAINPQFIVHDKDQNVTDYQSLGVSGLSGGFHVTLSEGSAVSVVNIPVAAGTGKSGELIYTVFAKDATNSQVRSGRVIFSAVAEGTTATCQIGTPEELDNTPTGTLTATIACDAATANLVKLTINPTSSLSQTTLEAYGTVILVGAGEPLPQ